MHAGSRLAVHSSANPRDPRLLRGSALLGFGIEAAWTDLEGAIMQSASKENGSIKIVGPADRPKVIAVLATAFTTCLLLRWLYPEPERYLRHFAGFLEYYAGDPYFDGSGAYLEDGQKGALLWLTDKAHRNDKRMMEYLLGSVPEDRRTETERLFEEFGKYHPEEPHWYFTMLGIDPMHQGSGRGGRLFQYGLAIPDEAKGLAFNEATSLGPARLYERLGWKIGVRFRSAVRRPFSRWCAVTLDGPYARAGPGRSFVLPMNQDPNRSQGRRVRPLQDALVMLQSQ